MKTTVFPLLVLVLVLTPTLLWAQSVRGSHRVIQLGEEIVEGRIEKPEAFYILRPTNLDYEGVAMQESFIPELLETVNEEPF